MAYITKSYGQSLKRYKTEVLKDLYASDSKHDAHTVAKALDAAMKVTVKVYAPVSLKQVEDAWLAVRRTAVELDKAAGNPKLTKKLHASLDRFEKVSRRHPG